MFINAFLTLLVTNPAHLFPLSNIKSKAFADTWRAIGVTTKAEGPLKNIVALFASADGVVLDLGPADGKQVYNYTNPGIKAMYGVEPCKELHEGLRRVVMKAGLGEKYHILDCGAQREELVPKLREVGVLGEKVEGVFDTIISSKVLCSVPDQEETVAGLYALLKAGGRMIVCEHVVNPWQTPKGSIVARAIQQLFMLQGWTFFLGGCHLTRDTSEVLKRAANMDGGWEKVDLESAVMWGTIPFVLGELQKKK